MDRSVREARKDELSVLELRWGDSYAVISRQGAQLLSYGRDGEEPIIWENPNAVFQQGTPIRGGVPVCWPWFGEIGWNSPGVQRDWERWAQARFHGLARQAQWLAEAPTINSNCVELSFRFVLQTQDIQDAPDMQVQLTFSLGHTLRISLTTSNNGVGSLAVAQVLHAYYAVSDIERVRVLGLDGLAYQDVQDGWAMKRQEGIVGVHSETTRIYYAPPERLYIEDPLWNRKTCITSVGSHSVVLWNPGSARSLHLDQFSPTAWKQMLCLETGRVGHDVLILPAKSSHTMAIIINTEALD